MSYYPIRRISELTGIPSSTLRAWERRYGLLNPERTPKGHRLYSVEDVDLVKKVVHLLKSNHTIGQAVKILKNPEPNTTADIKPEGHWAIYQQRMLNSIENYNEQNLGATYNEALSTYPVDMVTEHVIVPVFRLLGKRWNKRDAGIAEEHFFSAFLRNKLGARLHHEANRSRGSKIIVACLPGEYHELGVILFCIAAFSQGYQILYLGANLPLAQLEKVIERSDVSAVLLSGTKKSPWKKSFEKELKKYINSFKVPFMFGGAFSDKHKSLLEPLGAYVLGSDHVKAMDTMVSIIPAFSSK